jgi:predicted DCC family thiol-disulfide oxidoreductase YuxK
MNHPIILFDGVCNLCSGTVQFIIAHDPNKLFRFASLQSDAGQALLAKHALPNKDFKTIIFIENGRIYTKSGAALHIARRLGGLWQLLYLFIIVPPFIRNIVYDYIARNRYRFWGEKEECWLPTPDLRSRFL